MNLTGAARQIRSAFSRVVFVVAAALAVALGLTSSTASMAGRGAQPDDNGIAPSAMAQIQALLEEKETRTPAERKIDSQLLYARRMALGVPIAPGVQTLEVDVPHAEDGHVIVDVKANITGRLMLQLGGLSGEIKKTGGTDLRLHVDLDQIEAIAEQPDVLFVQPQPRAMTSRMDLPVDLPPATNAIGTGVGSATSQGDMAHRTAIYRGLTGATGAGVKIGVLSDGVTNLVQAQATGDLGAVTVLPGQTGVGDEGTAMLEIIHDLAPGAQLYFATGSTSIPSFADNIRALRAAGCDIIVDDILYFVESPFQDGQTAAVVSPNNGGAVTQAVKDVAASGALYFSAAGNGGNLNDSQSGVWEGDFAAGAATAAPVPIGGTLHRFTGTQDFDTVLVPSGFPTSLFWSDPLGASANDYDLFRLNATGTSVSSSSTNIQDGNDDPYEQVISTVANARLVIVKKTGAASRFLHLNTNTGRLSLGTAGQVHGHAATNNDFTFAVAATSASAVFPNTFTAASLVRTYSSDGPRRFFFRGDGSVITPGNVSATGGAVLSKPDFTAADAVAVSGAGGFPPAFIGTSAAASHAAAIAALVKSANSGFTQAQMRSALFALALDIEAAGVDRDSGAGILMAAPAQPLCTFTPVVPNQTFTANPANVGIGINASSPGCSWVVFSNVPWLNVTTAVGTGTGLATVSAPANRGPSRTGRITIQGGPIVTITQLGTPATQFDSPAGTTPIPDESTVEAPLTVSGLTQPIANLSVSLFLTHSFDSNLTISLIAPDGTIAKLTARRGGGSDNYGTACSPLTSRTTFDDNSPASLQNAPAPFAGSFRPEESLSRFLGKSGAAANGTWKLQITDHLNMNTGALQCWSLHINQGPLRGVANDFDGNGMADLAVFRPASGQWFINGGSSTQFGLTGDIPVPGDYDGDGVANLAVYRPSTGQWFVGGSHTTIQWGRTGDIPVPADYNGDQVTDPAVYRTTDSGTGVWLLNLPGGPLVVPWGMRGDVPMPGDYDGDGRADLAVYRPSSGQWFIAFAAGDFTSSIVAAWGVPGDVPIRADVDDDQKLDFVVFRPSTGTWFMSPTNSAITSFQFGLPGDVPVALDTNGDGFAELCVWRPATGTWFIRNRVAATTSTVPFGVIGDIPVGQRPRPASVPVSDFDGDGVSDLTVFRPSSGTWFTRFSFTGFATNASTQLGLNGDVTVNGDYDGDRRADQAVYRPSTGEWFILQSSNGSVRTASWGVAGDKPMPADYDGDGRIDLAVFRPSSAQWFILYSSNNTGAVFQWGLSTDLPFAQDFDGDGRVDLAVYRASSGQWFLLLSTTAFGQAIVRQWGLAGDVPLPADFDGDGRSEVAVFRPSTAEWLGIDALNGALVINRQWGLPGDIPVPHDYDGDGLIDPAVFRGNGNWFIRQSSNGALLNLQWGLSSDQPR